MKSLLALQVPTLLFVNKIDRRGARVEDLLDDVRRRLSSQIVVMNRPIEAGAPQARTTSQWPGRRLQIATILADDDTELLTDLVEDRIPSESDLLDRLAEQTASGRVHPLYFGSARGGQGVAELIDGICRLLPAAAESADSEARGTVFALERSGSGEKTAYLRMTSGTLRPRQVVPYFRTGSDGAIVRQDGRISSLEVVGRESDARVASGDIVKVKGLSSIRVGDAIGAPDKTAEQGYFARPSLETLVRPCRAQDTTALHAALVALAEQDPLISTRPAGDGQTSILLYGEIQKEIIAETLARDFGVEAVFEPSQTVHLERPAGSGSATAEMGHTPFVAGVGVRVEPAARGSGIVFQRETEYGALPVAFHAAIEESVRNTLDQGIRGWPVTDTTVTLIHTEFDNACSTGGDFRHLTPLVVMKALSRAGTDVYEPCHYFEAEIPSELLKQVLKRLLTLEARVQETIAPASSWIISGEIPTRHVHAMTRQLPELTSGEGVWWSRSQGDRLLRHSVPTRSRTDDNPLNPREYLHNLLGKVRSR